MSCTGGRAGCAPKVDRDSRHALLTLKVEYRPKKRRNSLSDRAKRHALARRFRYASRVSQGRSAKLQALASFAERAGGTRVLCVYDQL